MSGSQKGYGSALERLARDLCVLTDWYTERPKGVTYRELGERYDMSESAAHQIITNKRGRSCFTHLIWPVVAQQLIDQKSRGEAVAREVARGSAEVASGSARMVGVRQVLESRLDFTLCLLAFADDRRELERLRAGAA